MVVTPEVHHPEFFSRVSNLPVVTIAWTYASDIYGKAKESNVVFKKTLDTFETTAKFAAGRATPVVSRLEKPLMMVDSLACKGLNQVEEQLPVITKSPEEIVDSMKNFGVQKVDNVKSTVTSVANYGYTTAAKLLDNKIGIMALDGVNWTLAQADEYVEHYLPVGENEQQTKHQDNQNMKENGEVDLKLCPVETKVSQSVNAIERLSSKMQHRLYRTTLSKLQDIQLRGQETMKSFTPTIYLLNCIEMMMNNASLAKFVNMDKIKTIWEEINKEENEEEKQMKLEVCLMILARRLTRQLKLLSASAMEAVQTMPATIKNKMSSVLELATKIYDEVWKAASIKDLESVKQLKERLIEVYESLVAVVVNATILVKGSILKTASFATQKTEMQSETQEKIMNDVNTDVD